MGNADLFIAVVDDELPMRTMLGRLLRLASFRVSAYASGEAFLAALNGEGAVRPVCAILDVHMPGLSGFEVHSHLRAQDLHIPVVFITASDDVSLDRSAFEAEAASLLRKPFSNSELLAAIGKALVAPAGLP